MCFHDHPKTNKQSVQIKNQHEPSKEKVTFKVFSPCGVFHVERIMMWELDASRFQHISHFLKHLHEGCWEMLAGVFGVLDSNTVLLQLLGLF